ncbi:MAG: aminoacetone oxidase family FAD-binding enzyme [Planctomycetes bacterium]|nr:aminoacetone oxidase family FAD-binding enzyme [Planctomycetota bacterium]
MGETPGIQALELPARADVVVMGAGPAGLFAAAAAKTEHPELVVLVLDRRPFAGGQVPVAGGGRCNVTNAGTLADLMSGFGRDGRWLEPAFRHFDNIKIVRWFESRGVPMKEEEHGKIYPTSDDGADVQNAIINEATGLGVSIALRTRIEQINAENNTIQSIVANGKTIECRTLIIAGGGSGPKPTPTSGVGMATALGHTTVPPAPALAPIKLTNRPVEPLSGVAVNARVSAGPAGFSIKKPRVTKIGDLLFTHFGLSGPVILDLSHPIARLTAQGEPCELSLDLLPDVDDARAHIDECCKSDGAKSIKNVNLPGIPRRVFEHLLSLLQINPDRRASELRAPERDALAKIVKDWRFQQFEVTWAGAMVSGGGVALNEVDPKTMASRKIAGLFFAGETLNIQGECGGYNLQASFSTGALAGICAARHAASIASKH